MVHSLAVRASASPQVILRWVFVGVGLFIVLRPDLILNSAQRLAPTLQTLFPNSPKTQAALFIAVMLLPLQGGVLCLISALGLVRGSRWSRWTGFVGCTFLLPSPSWLALIGLGGAVLIAAIPITCPAREQNKTEVDADYWTRAKNSTTQKMILGLSGLLLIGGING